MDRPYRAMELNEVTDLIEKATGVAVLLYTSKGEEIFLPFDKKVVIICLRFFKPDSQIYVKFDESIEMLYLKGF